LSKLFGAIAYGLLAILLEHVEERLLEVIRQYIEQQQSPEH
jgi:hypothetical protein